MTGSRHLLDRSGGENRGVPYSELSLPTMRHTTFRTDSFLLTLLAAAAFSRGVNAFSPDDFQQHIEQLKPKLPSKEFTILVEPPFIVIGDEPLDKLKTRTKSTVKWAVDH